MPSSATDQSPDFDALDRGLHVLAEPRAGGARVDGEPLRDAVRRGVGGVGVEQPHRLHVQLVGDDRLEARRAASAPATTTVSDDSGSRLRSDGALAQRRAGRADVAHLVHRRDQLVVGRAASSADGQSVRCTDRSPVSPRQTSSVVSGSSGAATRQTVSSTV